MKTDQPSSNRVRNTSSRREFLQLSGSLVAGSLLAATTIPRVHAAEENTIRLALIGCGGRGSGAVEDACAVAQGPVQLVAMADVIESRMNSSHTALSEMFPKNVDVPPERRFVGFDAYRKAIDCLGPGDVAMLTGYAGFRPVQLEYAVARGVHVFMEKSFAVDPPAARRVIQAGADAGKKNLKIAAGLMCRHSVNRQELIKQIRDGVLGDLQLIRAYRMEAVGPLAPKPPAEDELLWQFRNFFRFLWVSGGLFAEMDIHQIDEICWLKDCAARAGPRDWWPHCDERRLQSEPRFVRDRVDLCRRDQGHRCRTVRGRLSQRVRHVRTWNQVCGAVLRQYPRRHGATVSRPADCEG